MISKKNFFCLNQLIALFQTDLEKFLNCQKWSGKEGKPLIKQVSKWKRAIRKGHTSFLLFYFWGLKWVPIDSTLNSASRNLTYCLQKCRRGTKKSSQTWESGCSRKTRKCRNQSFFCRKLNRNSVDICQILILTLWLVTPPCFLAKVVQEEIKPLFWHIWLKFFLHYCLFISISAIISGNRGSKLNQ